LNQGIVFKGIWLKSFLFEYSSNGYSVNENILFKGIFLRGLPLFLYSVRRSLTEKSDILFYKLALKLGFERKEWGWFF
jgi:hypothetical protein